MRKKSVKLYNYTSVLDEYYNVLLSKKGISKLKKMHIPVSDVFYVQKAIEMHTGVKYSLDHVERAMYLEGHLSASDVLDPNVPRGYCSYDHT